MKTIRPTDLEVLARLRGEMSTLLREWKEWRPTAMLRFDELGRQFERINRRLDRIERRLDRQTGLGEEEPPKPEDRRMPDRTRRKAEAADLPEASHHGYREKG